MVRLFKALQALLIGYGLFFVFTLEASADEIPIVDAHSQIDCTVSEELLLRRLDELGINRVLLSTRGGGGRCAGWSSHGLEERTLAMARSHPAKVAALLSMKLDGWAFNELGADSMLKWEERAQGNGYAGLGELLIQHARHEHKNLSFPELDLSFNDVRVAKALEQAKQREVPVILHVELRDNRAKSAETILDIKKLANENKEVNFGLIHMGQASAAQASDLIESSSNIFFITSHADSLVALQLIKRKRNGVIAQQGWTNLFRAGCAIKECPKAWKKDWKNLIVNNPKRFVLAFDNVFVDHWGQMFTVRVNLWRRALSLLPKDVAHKVAYENAVRLWRLRAVSSAQMTYRWLSYHR